MNDLLSRVDPPRPLMSPAEQSLYAEARETWLTFSRLFHEAGGLRTFGAFVTWVRS